MASVSTRVPSDAKRKPWRGVVQPREQNLPCARIAVLSREQDRRLHAFADKVRSVLGERSGALKMNPHVFRRLSRRIADDRIASPTPETEEDLVILDEGDR